MMSYNPTDSDSTTDNAGPLVPAVSPDAHYDIPPWRPILQVSNQIVLYNPTSHALSVNVTSRDLKSRYGPRGGSLSPTRTRHALPGPSSSSSLLPATRRHRAHHALNKRRHTLHPCPYCNRVLPPNFRSTSSSSPSSSRGRSANIPADDIDDLDDDDDDNGILSDEDDDDELGHAHTPTLDWAWCDDQDPAYEGRAANYFHLLELSNEAGTTTSPPSLPSNQPVLPSLPPPPPPPRSTTSSFSSSSASREDCPEVRNETRGNAQSTGNGSRARTGGFPAEAMAEGYFKAFFQEEYKLGMGANGSVFLCQHVLDRTPLGHFAVKKIAVGESHSYLLKILREVRLLEQMRHPNIITYHHAWLENCQFSPFGPKVPTLHVLMQWAEGGSLDDFIDVRLGRPAKHIHVNPLARLSTLNPLASLSSVPGTPTSMNPPTLPTVSTPQTLSQDDEDRESPDTAATITGPQDIHSRSARIRAFRAYQKASPEEKERMRREMNEVRGVAGQPSWKAVHLLSAEEVKSLFSDVVEGLAFLHIKSILHLDLKPGNVLLTWDEGKLIPRAMLSDFGTSRDMLNTSRVRSGNTGTLEYSAPECLPSPETGLLRQIDSKADMWSLGMILHKLLFFRLPYRYASDGDTQGQPLSTQEESEKLDKLEKEVASYPGFRSTPPMLTAFEARRLPRSFLILLESLLNALPLSRPPVERISVAIKEGKFNPQEPPSRRQANGSSTLSLSPFIPMFRRGSMSTPPGSSTPGSPSRESGWRTGLEGEPMEETPPIFALRDRIKLLAPPEGSMPSDPRDLSPGVDPRRGWVKNMRCAVIRKWEGTLLARAVGRIKTRLGREMCVRIVKSCLLSVKVLTISRMCVPNTANFQRLAGYDGSLSRLWALVLLALALLDTVSDELWHSAVLLLVHVVGTKLVCGGDYS